MKATLEFFLPDDQYDFDNAVNGSKWRSVVEDMAASLGLHVKHGDPQAVTAEIVREELYRLLGESGLEI